MGFDLKPQKKDVGYHHMGAFSWSWMLNSGVGLVLGTGPGITAGQFVCRERPDGLNPHCNDGAKVTAKEAQQMVQIARWVADHQDALYDVWMSEPEERRKQMDDSPSGLYNHPVRRDFVEKIRAFADWAEKSGGFEIH